jgi:septal ring factor EnvC (AmiA/AmiB activator)
MKVTKQYLKKLIKEELTKEMSNPVPTQEAMDPLDKAMNKLESMISNFIDEEDGKRQEQLANKYLPLLQQMSADVPLVKKLLAKASKNRVASKSNKGIVNYVLTGIGDETGMGYY